MSKAKFSLTNGSVVEKPVVTCFQGSVATYLVIDNEANGQMGYPIIGISRLNNNVAEKITDQGEWASVKDNLKTIIGGTALPYVNVPEVITAPEDFYTQLTLPVASFDVLKQAYIPAAAEAPAMPEAETPAPEVAPITEPEAPAAPTIEPVNLTPEMPGAPISEPSVIGPTAFVDPTAVLPQPEPAMAAPVITPLPVTPETPTPEMTPLPVTTPSEPVMPTPMMEPPVPGAPAAPEGNADVQAIKEQFMQSCENMFDALIKKFENK